MRFLPRDKAKTADDMSKWQSFTFGLIFCAITLGLFYLAFIAQNNDSGLFMLLFAIIGVPLGLVGYKLLFAGSKERKHGYMGPFTLYLVGATTFAFGAWSLFQGHEGAVYFVSGSIAIFALGKKRQIDRNKLEQSTVAKINPAPVVYENSPKLIKKIEKQLAKIEKNNVKIVGAGIYSSSGHNNENLVYQAVGMAERCFYDVLGTCDDSQLIPILLVKLNQAKTKFANNVDDPDGAGIGTLVDIINALNKLNKKPIK